MQRYTQNRVFANFSTKKSPHARQRRREIIFYLLILLSYIYLHRYRRHYLHRYLHRYLKNWSSGRAHSGTQASGLCKSSTTRRVVFLHPWYCLLFLYKARPLTYWYSLFLKIILNIAEKSCRIFGGLRSMNWNNFLYLHQRIAFGTAHRLSADLRFLLTRDYAQAHNCRIKIR